MALSMVTYIGDGVTNQFPINFALGYLSKDDVQCRVGNEEDGGGNPVYRNLIWISDSLVQVDGAIPGDGVPIVITRTVNKTALAHVFADGEPIDEGNLDDNFKQDLMAIHEFLDGRIDAVRASDLDMGNNQIINLADGVLDTDAANMRQLNQTISEVQSDKNAAAASATAAAGSATAAATSAANAQNYSFNAYNSFVALDRRYLGEKATDPLVDNQGAALVAGALYWNSTTNSMREYHAGAWQDWSIPTDGSVTPQKINSAVWNQVLISANNHTFNDYRLSYNSVSGVLELLRSTGQLITINGRQCNIPVTPPNVLPSGATPGIVYYIYAHEDGTSGNISATLEYSTTGYIKGNDGQAYKTGDFTRVLVGIAVAATASTWDTQLFRTAANGQPKITDLVINNVTGWTSTSAEIGSGACRVPYLAWKGEPAEIEFTGYSAHSLASSPNMGIFDTGGAQYNLQVGYCAAANASVIWAMFVDVPNPADTVKTMTVWGQVSGSDTVHTLKSALYRLRTPWTHIL